MVDKYKRIVFILKTDNGDVHRIEVVAASVSEAWEALPAAIRQTTLISVRSFKMGAYNGVA